MFLVCVRLCITDKPAGTLFLAWRSISLGLIIYLYAVVFHRLKMLISPNMTLNIWNIGPECLLTLAMFV